MKIIPYHSKLFELIGVAFLAIGLSLVLLAIRVSADKAPKQQENTIVATPALSSSEGMCFVNAATPCATIEGNSVQPQPTAGFTDDEVVHAVVFWMQGCPHCEVVMNSVLPQLQQKYGNKLAIQPVELKDAQDVDRLYQLGSRLGFLKDNIGVPFLMIGDRFLVGDQAIKDELPGLIDQELARGGVRLPSIPEFNLSADRNTSSIKTENRAVIYLFWREGCPHCTAAMSFLQALDQASEQVELRTYEVRYVEENRALFTQMAKTYGFEAQAVPTIFIGKQHWQGFGDQIWEGYTDQVKSEIQAAVDVCLASGCPDAGAGIIPDILD